jgi:lipoprotein-releasing system permease protein
MMNNMAQSTTFSSRWRLILRYGLRRTINYFAICAVFLSIACLFTVNAVMKGFDQEMQALFKGSLSDVIVDFHWDEPKLQKLEEELTDYQWSAPLNALGMIRFNGYLSGIQVRGVDPIRESKLKSGENAISFQLLDQKNDRTDSPLGGLLDLFGEENLNPSGILVGSVLSRSLGISIGDKVHLILPNWLGQASDHAFIVKDIFHTGYYEDDGNRVYLKRQELSDMLKHPNGYSNIQINYKDGQTYQSIENDLSKKFPTANISTWRDQHAIKLRAVVNERKLIVLILSLIVLVASFGILAIQWSFVQEKTRDIGLLRAMGFKSMDIFSIFLGVSWIVGVIGLILGLLGGVVLSTYANNILKMTGWQPFPDGIYYMDEGLPFCIEMVDIIWISCLSLTVTTLAGFLPAYRSIRIEPIKAIAYE